MPSKHASLVDYVANDLWAELRPTVRRMFGGHGFYANGKMFALEAEGRIYLKVDASTQPAFEAAGCEPFRYSAKDDKQVTMSYWTMPEDALENRERAMVWANKAITVAQAPKRSAKDLATQRGSKDVKRYLSLITEPGMRHDVQTLHDLIRKALPKLTPHITSGLIGYGSYRQTYADGHVADWPPVALSARKHYIAFYVCATKDGKYLVEGYKKQLPKADIGKSCIRFKRLSDVDPKVLLEIAKKGATLLGAIRKEGAA